MNDWQDDDRLLAALRDKDGAAFRWLFNTYSDRIYRLAAGLLESDVEADGVVQDTFLKFIEKIDRFEGRSSIGTWLYRVAYNLCQDRLRARRPLTAIEQESRDDGEMPLPAIFVDWTHTPELLLDEEELQEALRQAVEALPITLRSTFLMRDVEGLSTADCAAALEISDSACKVRLHRARLQLREALSGRLIDLPQL